MGTTSLLSSLCAVLLAQATPPEPSFLDNGTIRLGVDLHLGGAITWLSESGSERNVINGHDYGRQVQMSFYSGPVPYTPDGKEPDPVWRNLGWNPIQTGDVAGNPSRVIEHHNDGREILVRCVPMHWPLDDEPAHCTFETRIRLEENRAHVHCVLENARRDHTRYPPRGQELPAVYTNGPWWRLVTYDGPRPFTGDDVRTIHRRWSSAADLEAGSPWASWQATEGWAALLDDGGRGLGVVAPGPLRFAGGFFGTPGAGGPRDAPTGYLSPTRTELLDADIRYEYDYVLVLGTEDEIRSFAAARPRDGWLPDYRFARDRQHWTMVGGTDQGWPIEGELAVSLEGPDPQLVGPFGFWDASAVPRLYLEASFATDEESATLYWMRHGDAGFTAANAHSFAVASDGRYHSIAIELAGVRGWEGPIVRLRLDPVSTGGPDRRVRVRSLGIRPVPDEG